MAYWRPEALMSMVGVDCGPSAAGAAADRGAESAVVPPGRSARHLPIRQAILVSTTSFVCPPSTRQQAQSAQAAARLCEAASACSILSLTLIGDLLMDGKSPTLPLARCVQRTLNSGAGITVSGGLGAGGKGTAPMLLIGYRQWSMEFPRHAFQSRGRLTQYSPDISGLLVFRCPQA